MSRPWNHRMVLWSCGLLTPSSLKFYDFYGNQVLLRKILCTAVSWILGISTLECNRSIIFDEIHTLKPQSWLFHFFSKFLPSSVLSPNTRRLAGRSLRSDGVDVVPYGSYCSNLFLPWSDIDLAITGLHFPSQQQYSIHHYCTNHSDASALRGGSAVTMLEEGGALATQGSPGGLLVGDQPSPHFSHIEHGSMFMSLSAASIVNQSSTAGTFPTNGTSGMSSTSMGGNGSDPRHEILHQMTDFFDRTSGDSTTGKVGTQTWLYREAS